uniref:Golgi associated, gamma adaptin ear containing, ARF binding protein 3a n=1 Tax=Pygocentrus nattereri TaxID=42514 RepID=A0AAR2LMY0_PYGNA
VKSNIMTICFVFYSDKATNPSNRQEDWEYIIGFCDQINKELEGPQISVRLLAHKIQSPQEWEALQALTVLEACMKNCGRRFHNEVGKFRFLNELIKVVSPKYLGDRVSEKVKIKVIEMLFSWSTALPDETKITEAYQMLKRQGIVTTDPEVPADKTLIPSPPDRPHNPVFENEEKSKRLAELLKSKKPEDLQEANRLIKNMVKEDEARVQKVAQRTSTLLEVNNSVKLLNEMLRHFSKDQSTQADRELLKDLHDDCDKLRTTVFKLATETEDDDSSLGRNLWATLYFQQLATLLETPTLYFHLLATLLETTTVWLHSLPTLLETPTLCFHSLATLLETPTFPVTAYDKDGVCVLLHFASNCPPGRPDVLVMVVSMLNTAPLQVKNLTLQAAVPKSMRVKLQPPSGMELAPFNPILPPSAITQVMLLANPLKEKMRLRYKLMFVLGDRQCSETGEVDKFPPVERWGRL